MEKIMYPLKTMWITQTYGIGTYSHTYNKALDDQGNKNTTRDNVYAPFTGKVARKYAKGGVVWFTSIDKVQFADGTIDYATMFIAHDNDTSDLKVGQVIKQGEVFYQEGNNGQVTGIHIHFEIQAGATTSWVPAKDGSWNLPKGKRPEDCYYIDDSYVIKKTLGLKFKNVKDSLIQPPLNYFIYVVKGGDNLSKIASKYKTTWQKIYSDNKALIDKIAKQAGRRTDLYNYLKIGTQLRIYK